MRLIDADAVIKEVESALNKGVYKTMIIQLIKNAPSCCDELIKKSINECKTVILEALSSVDYLEAVEFIDNLIAAGYDLEIITAARRDLAESGIIRLTTRSTKNGLKFVFEKSQCKKQRGWFERFIADCCDVERNYRVSAGDLIAAYKEWARSVGEYEGRRGNEIYSAMIAAGFEQIKPRNVKTWLGLRLKTK